MPYQQNLGNGPPTSADIRGHVTAPTWASLQSDVTSYYRADEGLLSPPYIQALIKESLYSRAGPGTAYATATSYNAGYVVTITGQYGNWLQTNTGDYIPLNKTADAVAVAQAEAKYKAQAEAARLKAAQEEAARLKAEAEYKAQAEAKAAAAAKAEAARLKAQEAAQTLAAIKAAIVKETPAAIKEVLESYDFPAAGISDSTVKKLVQLVVARIVFRVIQALGGVPDR